MAKPLKSALKKPKPLQYNQTERRSLAEEKDFSNISYLPDGSSTKRKSIQTLRSSQHEHDTTFDDIDDRPLSGANRHIVSISDGDTLSSGSGSYHTVDDSSNRTSATVSVGSNRSVRFQDGSFPGYDSHQDLVAITKKQRNGNSPEFGTSYNTL